jgi:PAS domain S-box-containing protein
MTDLVCLIDGKGVFKYASPSHVTVLGYPSEAFEGSSARNWLHEEDSPLIRSLLMHMYKNREEKVLQFRFQNGEKQWIWLLAFRSIHRTESLHKNY